MSEQPTATSPAFEKLQVGDPVLCWPGERKGPGYLLFVAYGGVHDVGGQPCIYVRPMGGHARAIALTHVEVPDGD